MLKEYIPTRRDFLEMVGVSMPIGIYFVGGPLTLGRLIDNKQQKQISNSIGTTVSLKLGETYTTLGFYGDVVYSGMPNEQRFLLQHGSKPFIFQLDSKEIEIGRNRFSVLKVTPENIILQYLGIKQQ